MVAGATNLASEATKRRIKSRSVSVCVCVCGSKKGILRVCMLAAQPVQYLCVLGRMYMCACLRACRCVYV